MIAATQLQLVLVTPEKVLRDEPVEALRFPLFDGQIGTLPGRAPMVGRLGYGELKITGGQGPHSYYLDGGFVQVKGSVVSLLTNRAVPAEEIDRTEAQELLEQTRGRLVPAEEMEARDRDQQRARRMLAMAKPIG